jgi:hypothetical protein
VDQSFDAGRRCNCRDPEAAVAIVEERPWQPHQMHEADAWDLSELAAKIGQSQYEADGRCVETVFVKIRPCRGDGERLQDLDIETDLQCPGESYAAEMRERWNN